MSNTTLEVTLDLGELGEHDFTATGTFIRGCAGRDTLANGDPGYPAEPDSFELESFKHQNSVISFINFLTPALNHMLLQTAREIYE